MLESNFVTNNFLLKFDIINYYVVSKVQEKELPTEK